MNAKDTMMLHAVLDGLAHKFTTEEILDAALDVLGETKDRTECPVHVWARGLERERWEVRDYVDGIRAGAHYFPTVDEAYEWARERGADCVKYGRPSDGRPWPHEPHQAMTSIEVIDTFDQLGADFPVVIVDVELRRYAALAET